MPVKIRLTRMGKKKQPSYRVVVMDSRKPRDGAYIEQIGRYDPRAEPSIVEIDNDKALAWLQKGAQPTDRARKLLEISGAWTRFRVAKGDIHTIGETAPTPPPAPAAAVAEVPPVTEAAGESVEEPVEIPAEEPVTEAVAVEAAAEPVAEEPALAGEEPAAEQSVAEEPAVEEAVAEEPADEEELT